MPYLLRFLDNSIENFLARNNSVTSWLPSGKAPGNAILGIGKLTDSKMSVYKTDGSEDSIKRIVVAKEAKDISMLNSTKSKTVIALLAFEAVVELGIEIDEGSLGATADEEVNNWHCDLINLDTLKLAQIVDLIYSDSTQKKLIKPEYYCSLIKEFHTNNYLKISDINEKYRKVFNI